jgi:hypothetical protein
MRRYSALILSLVLCAGLSTPYSFGESPDSPCAWGFDPIKRAHECSVDQVTKTCGQRYWEWVAEGYLTLGYGLPTDPQEILDQGQMQEVMAAASCWLERNGYLNCNLDPCVAIHVIGEDGGREVVVSLIYQAVVEQLGHSRWLCRESRPVFVSPRVLPLFFSYSNGTVGWADPPPRHEVPAPCARELLELPYPLILK